MKINFIIPFKRISGGIRVVYIYAKYLTEQGHHVICYLPMISYPGKDQNLAFRVKASLSNTFKREKWFQCNFTVKAIPKISDALVRDADVVIATSWQTAYDVKKLSAAKGRKFYFVQDYEIFNGEKDAVEGTYQLGIPMITISKALKKRLNTFSHDVSVVYNGLFDNEYIHTEKNQKRKFTVMLMYHEAEHKGTQRGLGIIHQLEKNGMDFHVNIFGRRIFETFPKGYTVLENPSREALVQMYQNSDIYLFMSTIEAWGLPIVEAMANQCAVIGRKLGALEELFDGANAVIVQDDVQMYQKITELMKDRHQLHEIQKNGFDTAQQLNWKASAEKFIEIINR
ncbi:hypothetical protein SAMN02745687_00202 [Lachnospiraceae bacterium NK3A20]|nr:hypothetical protein SAMN02745687_00202 [Lachnospiraceae bacterium NK3A20]